MASGLHLKTEEERDRFIREADGPSPLRSVISADDADFDAEEFGRELAELAGDEFDVEQFKRELEAIPEVRNEKGELLAPNGKVSNIQNLGLWRTVRHPNFLRWFGDWINEPTILLFNKGELTNEQIRQLRSGMVSGTVKAVGLNEQGEQGRVRGGRRNVEASLLLAAKERTSPTPSRGSERFRAIEEQEKTLERYTKAEGIWIDEQRYSHKQSHIDSGGEARVYEGETGDRVRKFKYYGAVNPGTTLLDFINDEISSFNAVFPETAYTLEGFSRDKSGKLQFVLDQPHIQGRLATEDEIKSLMTEKGFEEVNDGRYANAEYNITDLDPRNVLYNETAQMAFVIDANVTPITSNALSLSTEGVSKVLDENGEPLAVYRGDTKAVIIEENEAPFYFTSSISTANGYTQSQFFRGGDAPNMTKVYLSLKNPLIIDALGKRHDNIPVPWHEWKPKVFGGLPRNAYSIDRAYHQALMEGYDGLIVRNVVDTLDRSDKTVSDVYVASRPNQIKSVFNRGSFSQSNNIMRSVVGRSEAPAFYSALEKAVEAKMPTKASAEQIRNILKGPGVRLAKLGLVAGFLDVET